MARDLSADIDRLSEQFSELRSLFTKQASAKADEATSFFAPRARAVSKQVRQGTYDMVGASRRNPAITTGTIIGVLAVGALIGLALSSAASDE
jgi:hypothetical protein